MGVYWKVHGPVLAWSQIQLAPKLRPLAMWPAAR